MKPTGRPAREWGEVLGADFFARPSDEVAHDLIGKVLWRDGVGGGRLTEVEAYLPHGDPASHSYGGKTRRNASMFGPPGRLYVYLSYGIHVVLNLVCDAPEVGAAVLIRSFEPIGDVSVLRQNRGLNHLSDEDAILRALACGPGRVGQALGLRLDMDGTPLGEVSGLWVVDDGTRSRVVRTSRVGISKGTDLPLRFLAAGSRFVSRKQSVRVSETHGRERRDA